MGSAGCVPHRVISRHIVGLSPDHDRTTRRLSRRPYDHIVDGSPRFVQLTGDAMRRRYLVSIGLVPSVLLVASCGASPSGSGTEAAGGISSGNGSSTSGTGGAGA